MDIGQNGGNEGVMMENIKEKFDLAEKIGVIGSPSSTSNLTIDILGTAVNKRLVGSLSVFNFNQEGIDNYAMGQVTEVQLQNVWTQDPTMRGIIRQKGRVDPITERQDVHTARMMVSSVFSESNGTIEPSVLGTVPATGTSIRLLDSAIMEALFNEYSKELFYLGYAYGTEIPMPMWFKHFGKSSVELGGIGEAYHIGVFGKTGSGKSVLAKMMALGYARHKSMSLFILDPQGEFSRDMGDGAPIRLFLEERYKRSVEVYNLHNLVLSSWDLFKQIFKNSGFFDKLGIFHEDNKQRAVDEIVKILKRKKSGIKPHSLDNFTKISPTNSKENQEVPLTECHERFAFDRVWEGLGQDSVQNNIYTSKDTRERLAANYLTSDNEEFFILWKRITNLFSTANRTKAVGTIDLVKKIKNSSGNIVVIDLSEGNVPSDMYWNDSIKFILIREFLDSIKSIAEFSFKENTLLNCLVVIDEAHRLAPRDNPENEDLKRVKESLIDAVRTTRKYGLGWMFISQTLSSLDKEIINQIRVYVFGFGLGWGIERLALKEIIGGAEDSIRLYQMFRDPQSSLGKRTYSFMTIGPISPLSFQGTPLFFNALDYPDEFIEVNNKHPK